MKQEQVREAICSQHQQQRCHMFQLIKFLKEEQTVKPRMVARGPGGGFRVLCVLKGSRIWVGFVKTGIFMCSQASSSSSRNIVL